MSHARAERISLESPLDLHFEAHKDGIRAAPGDRDSLAPYVELAVEACQAFKNQIVFVRQFEELVDHLGSWLSNRRDQLSEGYLTLSKSGLLFLVVLNREKFDPQIEQEITGLDLDIARDDAYDLINLSVHVAPRCSHDDLKSFLSPRMAIRLNVHGQGS